MDKFNTPNLASANQATDVAQAERQDKARPEVLSLDEGQLGLVGGGDSTPNWQDPPTP